MLNRSRSVLCGVAACLIVSLAMTACSKSADKSVANAATPDKSKAVLTVNGTAVSQGEMDMLLRQQPDVQDQMEMSKTSILAQSYVKDFFANHKVTDAQLTAAYDKMKADASGNQYRARHILVKTEDEAKAIIVKLNKDPNAFSDIAKAQSQDPVSKAKGGDLGWFDGKTMVPEFADAVSKLGKGKISQEPVKSPFGYHVIALDDVRPAADSIPPFEQMKASLTQRVQQEDLKKTLEGLKAQAKIEVKS